MIVIVSNAPGAAVRAAGASDRQRLLLQSTHDRQRDFSPPGKVWLQAKTAPAKSPSPVQAKSPAAAMIPKPAARSSTGASAAAVNRLLDSTDGAQPLLLIPSLMPEPGNQSSGRPSPSPPPPAQAPTTGAKTLVTVLLTPDTITL